MSKPIKYMAWDKQYKKISKVNMILFSTNEIDVDDNLGEPKSMDHYELMEFTGLCDKNQKEIYEGYLCKYYSKNGVIIGVIEWEKQAGAFWLKWNEKSESGRVFHRYKELKATFSDGEIFMIENLEVIGHKYENTNE